MIAALVLLTAPPPSPVATPTATASPTATAAAATSTPTPRTAAPTVAATPTRSPIPLPTFVQLSAPSRDVVWALVAGERLFRSTDRGDTWEERPIPAEAARGEISFVSEREGWVASYLEGAPDCAQRTMRLWHTVDAGATYEGGSAVSGLDARPCKGGISFVDAQRGFVGAWARATSPLVYRTADGGRTWTASRPLPDPLGFRAQDPSSLLAVGPVEAVGRVLFTVANGQTFSGGSLYVYKSADGGATWGFAATVPMPASIVFLSEFRWIHVLPQGSRATADGGASWNAFTTDYSQAAPIGPAVAFADASVGYATVRGGIQRTLDGGAHWVAIPTPGT